MERRFERLVRLVESDLYRLTDEARTVVLDALVAGAPLPIVLGETGVVCTGSLEPDVVGDALVASTVFSNALGALEVLNDAEEGR